MPVSALSRASRCWVFALAWCVGALAFALPDVVIAQQRTFTDLQNRDQLRRLLEEDSQGREQELLSPVDRARLAAEQPPGDSSRAAGGGLTAAPPAPAPVADEQSRIEAAYSERVGQPLSQFGYDVFRGIGPDSGQFSGAVDDQYRLGIGDELVVTFHGGQSRAIRTRVDREGRVLLPGLPPIAAAGRPYGEFRAELKRRVASAMIGTEVFVSLGAVRMIRVIVTGEVERPGLHRLTGLSTVLDALFAAGGVGKSGSLRDIRVNRRSGGFTLDFYELLLQGRFEHDITLMDGDQILVPTIGPTAAVAGDAKRPGIFEQRPGRKAVSLAKVLEWAGGPLKPAGSRYVHFSLDANGQDQVTEQTSLAKVRSRDGDIVLVRERGLKFHGSVMLTGHVRAPGMRSVAAAPAVSRLVGNLDALLEGPYLPFAALSRVNRSSGARDLFAVDLARILTGEFDESLQGDDILIVLGLEDVRYLTSIDVQNVLTRKAPVGGRVVPVGGGQARMCRGLVELAKILASQRAGRFAAAVRGLVTVDAPVEDLMTCPRVYDQFPELLVFVLEYAVALENEIRTPGVYPVLPQTPLASVVAYAGGTTREADLTNVELGRQNLNVAKGTAVFDRVRIDLRKRPMDQVLVGPGDVVRFKPVFSDRDTGPVYLFGEFRRPGIYDITRGERLSETIARAGGLTAQAYPYGAVFTRERAKKREKENLLRYVRDLQAGLTIAISSRRVIGEAALASAEVMQSFIEAIQAAEPVGRVVVQADPTVLQVRPEEDVILEPGDRVYMPKRPTSVTITGEVLNAGSVAFKTGAKGDDYIAMAGGYGAAPVKGRTFIVLPNGIASPLSVNAWNYHPEQVPPGSTIVVPRDPLPFDWLIFTQTITDALTSLAVSAAAISVIGNN